MNVEEGAVEGGVQSEEGRDELFLIFVARGNYHRFFVGSVLEKSLR